jgi:hypothetical protein
MEQESMWDWIKANKGKAIGIAAGGISTVAGAAVAADAAGVPLPMWVKPVATLILGLFGSN